MPVKPGTLATKSTVAETGDKSATKSTVADTVNFVASVYGAKATRVTCKALRHGSYSVTCKQHHACLYFVSVHQMAPPLTVVADI